MQRLFQSISLALLAILACTTVTTANTPASLNPADFIWRDFKSCIQIMPTGKQIERKAPNTNRHDWTNSDDRQPCLIEYNADGYSQEIPELNSFWIPAIAASPGFSRVITRGEEPCCFSKHVLIQFNDRQPGYYYKHRPPKVVLNSVEDAFATSNGCRQFWNAWLVKTEEGLEQSFVYDAPKRQPNCIIPVIVVPAGFIAIKNGLPYYPGAALLDVRKVELYHDGTYWRITH